jgi:hypothetical protein
LKIAHYFSNVAFSSFDIKKALRRRAWEEVVE